MLPICGLMWFLRKPCEVLNVDDRSLILRSSPSRHQANSPRRLPVSVSWATVYRPSHRPLLRLRMLPYRSIYRSFVSSLSKAMCHVGEYRQCLITAQPVTGKCGSLCLCRDAARYPRRCTGRSVMPSIRRKTLLYPLAAFPSELVSLYFPAQHSVDK